MLRAGVINREAIVWRIGMSGWQPIAVHFEEAGVQSSESQATIGLRKPPPSDRRGKLWLICFLAIVMTTFSIAGFYTSAIQIHLITFFMTFVSFAIWWTLYIFVLRGSTNHRREGSGGLPLFLTGFAGVVQVLFTAIAVYYSMLDIKYRYRVSLLNNYTVIISSDHHSILVDGDVGEGLYDEIFGLWSQNNGIEYLQINSRGGLVEEALRIGRFIERNELTVISRKVCESACLAILFSGRFSYSEQDTSIGFHSTSPVVPSELADYYDPIIGDEFENYLFYNGVPRQLLDAAQKYGPNEMMYVPPTRLVALGALDGLVPAN